MDDRSDDNKTDVLLRKVPARLPLVSIIITNHNYADYLERAIDSAVRQTYPFIECIIVDDCSSDSSKNTILHKLSTLDTHVSSVFLDKNVGQMGAMIEGFKRSSGAFINFLDADDSLMPDFVATHVAAHLNSARSAAVSASDTIQIDANDQMLEGTFHCLLKDRYVDNTGLLGNASDRNLCVQPIPSRFVPDLLGTDLYYQSLKDTLHYIDKHVFRWSIVASTSLVYRRKVLSLIFPTDPSVGRICADYYLYQFAHGIGGTVTIPSAHSFYRFHSKNNFSDSGVVGGYYSPSERRKIKLIELELDEAIAQHISKDVEFWSDLLGDQQIVAFLQRGLIDKKQRREEVGKNFSEKESSIQGASKPNFLTHLKRFFSV